MEAKAVLTSLQSGDIRNLLAKYEPSLKELLNVSQAEIRLNRELFGGFTSIENLEETVGPLGLDVAAVPADGIKCERCWNYRTDTDSYGPWPVVCGRCRKALDEMGYSELNASVAQ